jgi:hypothetical protein
VAGEHEVAHHQAGDEMAGLVRRIAELAQHGSAKPRQGDRQRQQQRADRGRLAPAICETAGQEARRENLPKAFSRLSDVPRPELSHESAGRERLSLQLARHYDRRH